MVIVIVGVTQVGKTTTGKILAEKLNYKFLDLDEIIFQEFGSIENFQNVFTNRKKRYKEKCNIVLEYCLNEDDLVFVVSPIYSKEENVRLKSSLKNAVFINLVASPESIFERVGFYDENMCLLKDSDEYKQKHKIEIMNEIIIDNFANEEEFSIYDKLDTSNISKEEAADKIINFITKKRNNIL